MSATDKITKILMQRGTDGVLQSELPKLTNLSKSTVSEVISNLEKRNVIVRQKVTKNSYKIWLSDFYPNPVKGVIRVGILRASEYSAVVMAAKKIGTIRVFDNPIDLTRALCTGCIDVAVSPLVTQLTFACLMKNIFIFRVVAINGSGIVVGKKRCKKIGTTEMSTMELNLKKVNKHWNFVYFKSPERMIASLKAGEVDGIAIWEPYLTELSKDYDVIRFNEILGDFPCCSLAANLKFLKQENGVFQKFLHRYDNYCEKIDSKSFRSNAAKEISKYLKIREKIVEKSFSSFVFDFKFSNKDLLEFVERETFLRRESVQQFLQLSFKSKIC